MNAGSSHLAVTSTFTGDDRFMADYLRAELLDRVSRAEVSFLTRTSILERMTGPLCDADRGSLRIESTPPPAWSAATCWCCRSIARASGTATTTCSASCCTPSCCDANRRWSPSSTLERPRGTRPTTCPRRPSSTRSRRATPIGVARLVLRIANPVWASGRLDTVLRWMEWFSDNGLIEHQPAVAVHGALIFALVGRPGDAERWAEAAQRTTVTGTQADGNTMEGTLAYLRALLCRDGLDADAQGRETALDGLAPTSPYRPAMLHAEGVADLLEGDPDRADVLFARAADEATSAGVVPFVPVALAERGIVAIDEGRLG